MTTFATERFMSQKYPHERHRLIMLSNNVTSQAKKKLSNLFMEWIPE